MLNGLKVVHISHNTGSITSCLRGLSGSNYENATEVGAAHILEHLCTYASQKYKGPKKLRSMILDKGGRITGTTSRDDTAYFAKVLKKDYKRSIEYLSEIFLQPLLSTKYLEETKNAVKHEIYQNIENPKKHIGRISYKILYPPATIFQLQHGGGVEDVENVKLSKIRKFKEKHYYPANFVLSVCGDLDSYRLFKTVDKYFGKLNKNQPKVVLRYKPNYKKAFLIENRKNLTHMHLKIDYHGFKTAEKMKYPRLFVIQSSSISTICHKRTPPRITTNATLETPRITGNHSQSFLEYRDPYYPKGGIVWKIKPA